MNKPHYVLSLLLSLFSATSTALNMSELQAQFALDTGRSEAVVFVEQHRSEVETVLGLSLPDNLSLQVASANELHAIAVQEKVWLPSQAEARKAMQDLFWHWELLPASQAIHAPHLRQHPALYAVYAPAKQHILYQENSPSTALHADLLAALVVAAQSTIEPKGKPFDKQTLDTQLAGWAVRQAQQLWVQQQLLSLPNKASPRSAWQHFQQLPYAYGLNYVTVKHAQKQSIETMLQSLPNSTAQLFTPETFRPHHRIIPLLKREASLLKTLGANAVYSTRLGAYFIRVLLSAVTEDGEFADEGWDGDYLILAEAGEQKPLIWESRWENAQAALQFLERYRRFVEKRLGEPLFEGNAVGFDWIFPQAEPQVFLRYQDNKVLVIENREVLPESLK